MTVKAWLDGRPDDLAALARHFTKDPAIGCDDTGDYYLTSPRFDALWSDVSELRSSAASLLDHVNGTARLLDLAHRPVRLTERYIDDTGRGQILLMGTAYETSYAMGFLTVTRNGVPVEPPPSPAPDLARLGEQHSDVAEVFRLLAGDVLDWFTLYKVYEIVRHNVGGPNDGQAKQTLIGKGWVTEAEVNVFADSACSQEISGPAARHARKPRRTANSMTIQEARAFISRLTRCWLDSF